MSNKVNRRLDIPSGAVVLGERLAVIRLPLNMLVHLCVADGMAVLTTAGVPIDAKLIGMEQAPDSRLVLVFSHASFPLRKASGAVAEIAMEFVEAQLPEPGPEVPRHSTVHKNPPMVATQIGRA